MCGCALSVMLLTLAVVLPTLHDYSGTFQGGYRPGLQPQGGLLAGVERILQIKADYSLLPANKYSNICYRLCLYAF